MKHYPLIALLLLFIGLAALYNVSTPIFEAPDEFDHFSYAHWLASGHGLPHMVADRGKVGEIWQPPLYYALLAPLLAGLDSPDWQTIAPLNPYWPQGGGTTAHYHTSAEAFPYHQTALAVHLARFVSTLIGCLTILATYKTAQRMIPRYALVAAALVALNPQFIFISASINNDNLITALAALALWIATQGKPGRSRFFLLGLLWGLAALAKLSGLALGGVIVLAALYQGWQQRVWRTAATNLLLGGLTAGLVAGWYFGLNYLRYGDPLAWQMILEVTHGLLRPEPLTWLATLQYATFIRFTFWASFGYGLLAPTTFYLLAQGGSWLAGAGLVYAIWKNRQPLSHIPPLPRIAALFLLAAWATAVFLVLLRWMRLVTTTNQGRLLFPAMSSVAIGLTIGLAVFDRRRNRPGKVFACLLGVWAAAMPFLILGPAYAQPRPVTHIPNPTKITFGSDIALMGYELARPEALAGQPLTIHLYWQAIRPISESYVIAVHLLDSSGRVVSSLDTIPYAGRYPSPVWQVGQIFQDSYTLPSLAAGYAPGRGSLLVTLYPWGQPNAPLSIKVGEHAVGRQVTITTLKIAPAGPRSYTPSIPFQATFAQQARLLGYDLAPPVSPGRPLTVTLYWQALQPDGQDYTVFAHLIGPAGEVVSQADGPPQNNAYPTSLWAAAEQIADPHIFDLPTDLPAGDYYLLIGLYRPEDGRRLSAFDLNGEQWQNDAVQSPYFTIP